MILWFYLFVVVCGICAYMHVQRCGTVFCWSRGKCVKFYVIICLEWNNSKWIIAEQYWDQWSGGGGRVIVNADQTHIVFERLVRETFIHLWIVVMMRSATLHFHCLHRLHIMPDERRITTVTAHGCCCCWCRWNVYCFQYSVFKMYNQQFWLVLLLECWLIILEYSWAIVLCSSSFSYIPFALGWSKILANDSCANLFIFFVIFRFCHGHEFTAWHTG